ncbi:hypothetical protein ACKQTC_08060 [Peptococcus simiae]|uniref:Uncharacterized protein n=1 Tax=Peptococcus simiae TaxID=1643805 RepID=A0ABW9H0E0_9FIRM
MKLPLNYAIINYFVHFDEGTADDVMRKLSPDYSNYRSFCRSSIIETLMTARNNNLLEEVRYELDEAGKLQIYYRATPNQRHTITSYIGCNSY